jgi:hypothetical protein
MDDQEKFQLWKVRFEHFRSSNLPVKKWCQINKITHSTFYKWKKIIETSLREETNSASPTITELTDEKSMQWIALSVEGDERNHDHNVTSLSHGSAINDGIIIIDAIESAVQLSNADMTDTEDLAKKEGIVESFQNHVTSHASSSFNALLTVRLNDVNVDVPEDFKPEHLLAILQVIRRC